MNSLSPDGMPDEERREELLGWFRNHQQNFPNNELPSDTDLPKTTETMRELYQLYTHPMIQRSKNCKHVWDS